MCNTSLCLCACTCVFGCVYGVCDVCVCVNVYVRELTCLRDVVSLYFSRYILDLIS